MLLVKLSLVLSLCKIFNCATFENISLSLKWNSRMEDTKIVHIESDDSLRRYVGEFGEVLVQNQNIPELVKQSVSNLPKVTHLHLTKCGIKRIEPGAFQNLPLLTDLNLSDNLLEEIPSGIFDNLNFKTLYLDNNRIASIGTTAFNNLKMEYLFIDDNRISEWKSEWFQGTRLLSISMANNLLAILPRLAFEFLWHFGGEVVLINLTLRGNGLDSIDPDAFEGVNLIFTLNLQDNSLTHLEPGLFDSVGNIDKIDLSGNKINELYYEVFRKTKISQIILYDNFLTCVSTDIFNETSAEMVSVRNNPISCQCVEKWTAWKSFHKIPEIDDFDDLVERCRSGSNIVKMPLFLTICLVVSSLLTKYA